jgi:hypothetical protein
MVPGISLDKKYFGLDYIICMNVTVFVTYIWIENILYIVGFEDFLKITVSVLLIIDRFPEYPQKSSPS